MRVAKPIIFIFAIVTASTAIAQQVPTPGQVKESLKKSLELKIPPPQIQPERQQRPTAVEGKKITVRLIEFFGNTVYDESTLSALVASYLNRPVSLLDIYAAADAITDYYVKHGYSLASVSVPPQKVTDGIISFEISEGRIDHIDVEGNKSYKSDHVRQVLGDMKSGTLYRGDNLADGVHRLNELPGLKAKAIIKPGDKEGTSDIVIQSTEDRVNGGLSLDDYGRKDIGEFRLSAFAQVNNTLGMDDQLQLLALRSQEGLLTYYSGGYSAAVNANKTRFGVTFGHATFGVRDLAVNGKYNNGAVTVEQTLFDTRRSKATVNAGVSRTVANTDLSGLPLSNTLITLFQVGGSYSHTYDNQAVTQVAANVHTNFQKQDPAALTSGQTVHGNELFRLEIDAQHFQPIYERIGLLTHIDAVYSPDALVDTEKFALGGPQSVRGYQASQVRGDRGYLGSLSLIRPFGIGPVDMVGRVFTDFGTVWNLAPSNNATIASAGLGFDAQYRWVSAKLDWSIPIDNNYQTNDAIDYSFIFAMISVAF
ncbi:MAG: ShlB/FhaC/HecB family hemolysin secretion/activation protein [Stenotrophobium sp.]